LKLLIQGVEIPLEQKDIILARSAVNSFVESVRIGTGRSSSTSLYLTTLIMMYKKSTELLNELGLDNLQYVMTLLNANKEDV